MNQQPTAPPELQSCLVKLDRAHDRLQEFASRILDHREPNPYRLIRQEEQGRGNYVDYVYRVEVIRSPPLEASVTIGEFLYNVHSALDHLANRLVERAENDGNVVFPIFKNRAKFWRKDRDGSFSARSGAAKLVLMPDDAHGLIEDVQPYKRGNDGPLHPLWLLHELSNADKHHALHIMGSALTRSILTPTVRQDAQIEWRDRNYGPFENGDVIARLRVWITGPNPDLQFQTKFATTEAFAKEGPAAGREPGAVLRDILVYVLGEVFEKRFIPYFSD